jgi:hypothetical protein
MDSGEATTSPGYRISPSRPALATAMALRTFAASIPMNASLYPVIVRPRLALKAHLDYIDQSQADVDDRDVVLERGRPGCERPA